MSQSQAIRRHYPRRKPWRFFLIIFSVVCTVLTLATYGVVSYAERVSNARLIENLKVAEGQSVRAMRREAETTLIEVTSDLLFFRRLIERKLSREFDPSGLARVMLDFMQGHRNYDQLRFLDDQGVEQVRVDNGAAGAMLAPRGELQDISGAVYFRRARDLAADEVLISSLEASREPGRTEAPLKPVLRIVARVPDHGFVVVSYLARDLLENMESIGRAGLGKPLITNRLGVEILDTLRAGASDALRIAQGTPTFAEKFPVAWRSLRASTDAAIDDGAGGIMVFTQIMPSELRSPEGFVDTLRWTSPMDSVSDAESGWFVISHIDQDVLSKISRLGLRQSPMIPALYAALVLALALSMASWLSRQRAHAARLKILASRDALTGLCNRGEFEERLAQTMEHAKRFERSMALLFIDLDNFKDFNDTLGHSVGDDLLLHVANVLRNTMRESDVVGRVGGDEFAVILSEVRSSEDTDKVAANIREHLCRRIILGGKNLDISASVGGATYPHEGKTMAELYEQADMAMYRAKMKQRDAQSTAA